MSADCVCKKQIHWRMRLISDILEISNVFNLTGYIVTADTEKAFDSLSHSFLLGCLKKFGMQELQRHTLILNKVRAKVIQFLLIFLFYVLRFYFCLLKLVIKFGA